MIKQDYFTMPSSLRELLFKDIRIVCHILKRLQAGSDIMLDSQCRRRCQIWLNNAEKAIIELKKQAKRKSHDNFGIPADHS